MQNFPANFPLSTLSYPLAGTLLGRPCPFFARSLTFDHSLRVAVRAQNPQYVDNAVVSQVEPDGFPCQRQHCCLLFTIILSLGHPSRSLWTMVLVSAHQAG